MKMLAERAGVKLPEAEYDENARRAMNAKARIMELNKDAANYFYFRCVLRRVRSACVISKTANCPMRP